MAELSMVRSPEDPEGEPSLNWKPADLNMSYGFTRNPLPLLAGCVKEGIILLANRPAYNLFGYTPPQLKGMPFLKLYPVYMHERVKHGLAYYRLNKEPFEATHGTSQETIMCDYRDNEIHVELTINQLKEEDERGGPYLIAALRDITDKKRLEDLATNLLKAKSTGAYHENPIPSTNPRGIAEDTTVLNRAQEDCNLTNREATVLTLVAQGKKNHQIATELYLAEATVKHYVGKIIEKLAACDRTSAAVKAVKRGWISSD